MCNGVTIMWAVIAFLTGATYGGMFVYFMIRGTLREADISMDLEVVETERADERLKEIKDRYGDIHRRSSLFNIRGRDFDYLIQQSERVHRLERECQKLNGSRESEVEQKVHYEGELEKLREMTKG